MRKKNKCYNSFKNKLAISKLLSTIILIFFTIILSYVVIFFAQDIIGFFTGFENIKIESIWIKDSVSNRTAIIIVVRNDGHTTVIIKDLFINDKEYKQFSPEAYVAIYSLDEVKILDSKDSRTYAKLDPTKNAWIVVSFPKEKIFFGQKLELKIKTEVSEYPAFIEVSHP